MTVATLDLPISTLQSAQNYYGKTLQSTSDLRTSACCSAPPRDHKIRDALRRVHPDVSNRYYGCGSPIPPLLHNTTTLDLGCGTGRDCFVISQLAGSNSRVIGLDATESQLQVGRSALPWHSKEHADSAPITFLEGDMSNMSALIPDESVDVVVSNCVLNLTSDKDAVFAEIARVLKPGGELLFADIFSSRELDPRLQSDPVLHGECLAGAHYLPHLQRQLKSIGMSELLIMNKTTVDVHEKDLQSKLGDDVTFSSLTVRAFKKSISQQQHFNKPAEVIFRGDAEHSDFLLDQTIAFASKGDRKQMSAEVAGVLMASRYAPLFTIAS